MWIQLKFSPLKLSTALLSRLVFFVLFALSNNVFAVPSDEAFDSVPKRFRSQDLTLGSRALGEICYSRDLMPDGTTCNPAWLGEVKEGRLIARLFFGNGYAAVDKADRFVTEALTRDAVQDLFEGNNVISLEGHLGLSFTAKNFSAEFSPYRVQFASEIHNPNLPVNSVHAAIERGFSFAYGSSLAGIFKGADSFTAALKLRLLERRFVHGSFSLAQVVAEEPRDYLPSKKQTTVYLDPTFGWKSKPEKGEWGARVSFGVRNLGVQSETFDEYPDDIDVFGGVGVEAPMKYGRLRIGLDFVDLLYADAIQDRVRFGTSYQVGMTEAMLGVNSRALTAGLYYSLSFVSAGIAYEYLREDLDQGKPESRLATEIAFSL